MEGQVTAIARMSAGFAVFAITAGLVSRAILALMSGHSAAEGIGWQADILMANPVFQGMYFLMVFTVVSATFLGFALVWARMHHTGVEGRRPVVAKSTTTGRTPMRTGNLS